MQHITDLLINSGATENECAQILQAVMDYGNTRFDKGYQCGLNAPDFVSPHEAQIR